MTRLGVDISLHKTHVSKDTYEFAKRWIKGNQELSGIPLKGIIHNYKNIKVVYQNLFTYNMRMPFLGQLTLVQLISRVYNGLKINNRFLTSNLIHNSLYFFVAALRYTHGLLTYDELRKFIAEQSVNNADLVVPPQDVIPSFMKDVLSGGLTDLAYSSSNSALQFSNKIKAHFTEKGLTEISELTVSPLYNGCLNHVQRVVDTLSTFKLDEPQNDYLETSGQMLIDSMDNLIFLQADKLMSQFRNSSEKVNQLDKLFKNSFELSFKPKDEMDLMYGSSLGSHQYDSSS